MVCRVVAILPNPRRLWYRTADRAIVLPPRHGVTVAIIVHEIPELGDELAILQLL